MRLDALAEHGRHAEMLHLVVLGRRGAVRVDVVDVVGVDAGIGERVAHAADDRRAVRAGAGAVENRRPSRRSPRGCRARSRRARVARSQLSSTRAPAPSASTKPSRSFENGFDAPSRRIVRGRQRRQQREADQALRIDRTVGADAQRRLALAAPDRLDAELDRGRARRAGGRQRDRRALGAEAIGEMLGDRAELTPLVNGANSARRARAQQIVIADRAVGFRRRGKLPRDAATRSRPARPQETADPGNRLWLPMPASEIASSAAMSPCARRARSSRTARPERSRQCRRCGLEPIGRESG